jgi:hypothetical protein
MNRFLSFSLTALALLLTAPLCLADETFPVDHHEPITVRVLSGKNGKPVAKAHVELLAGYDPRDLHLAQWHQDLLTDGDGRVQLSNGLANLPLLRVSVLKAHGCSSESFHEAFSVELIRRDGLSAPNRCGTAIVPDAPGTFTLFIKGKKAAAKEPKPKKVKLRYSASSAHSAPAPLPSLASTQSPAQLPAAAPPAVQAPVAVSSPAPAPVAVKAEEPAAPSPFKESSPPPLGPWIFTGSELNP